EIERLCFQETPISASLVRKLLVKKDLTAIASLVPSATLQYLQNMPERVPAHATVRQKTPALVTGEK
ncbi:TPA: [citrate (pro-3S)-lyase] ligase, partial [Citrobacter farmeri]|nr:[citrate (pro-3S)-lyase] ligase [Citrobacter farmeri]